MGHHRHHALLALGTAHLEGLDARGCEDEVVDALLLHVRHLALALPDPRLDHVLARRRNLARDQLEPDPIQLFLPGSEETTRQSHELGCCCW